MDWSEAKFQLIEIAKRRPINHFKRFCTSPHTKDLFYISVCAICLGVFIIYELYPPVKTGDTVFSTLSGGIVAAMLGAVGWAYQAGNIRFGAADLFAGEIAALCRVAAVGQLMDRLAAQYCQNRSPESPAHDTSEYFTAYNNNAKDIEALDGDVVEAVAQFYANIKVFRDVLRLPGDGLNATVIKERQLNAIYYGFLAFESARMALASLIDDPDRSQEAILTAMVSEIPAYIVLYIEYSNRPSDLHWLMIQRRYASYCTLIRAIGKTQPSERTKDLAKQIRGLWKAFSGKPGFQLPIDWVPRNANTPARAGEPRVVSHASPQQANILTPPLTT